MGVFLKDKDSISSILSVLTVEEKVRLLTGDTYFSSYGIEKYGIPSILYLDSEFGVNFSQYYLEARNQLDKKQMSSCEIEKIEEGEAVYGSMDSLSAVHEVMGKGLYSEDLSKNAEEIAEYVKARMPERKFPTCFPSGIMMGASWSPENVCRAGGAIGKEAAAYQVDVLLGPNVNIHRDPRNGRLFEGFSEDPCLAATLAPAWIKGLQEQGVCADVKHFAANNQETLRKEINEHVSERAMHEIYLPAFKASVQEGRSKTVMSAYNSVNGVRCSQNKWLLTDVLQKEWGFDGVVVSDWGSVYDQVASLETGNTVTMPGPRPMGPILKAVRDGRLAMSVLDEACRKYLSLLVDIMEYRRNRADDFSVEESAKAAYTLAAEGITLLKNNDDLLPLRNNVKISFFGEKSKAFQTSGTGSGFVITDRTTSLYEETARITGAANVNFGVVEEDADVVVITVNKDSAEGFDHPDMDLPSAEKKMLLDAVAEAKAKDKRILVILNAGSPIETEAFIDDVDAFLWVYYPGQEGGKAAADILFGNVNPSGKLPITYPASYRDCPTYGNFPGDCDEVWYGEGIYVGYRWYDTKRVEPLYPFGFGLSYTNFEISNIRISSAVMNMDRDETLEVSVTVRNTGSCAGAEVIQVYISDPTSLLSKPEKELKAFRKVCLAAGEEKIVTFQLSKAMLESYDSKYKQWVAEPGWYHVLVGNSSRHIAERCAFRATGHCAYCFGDGTQMIRILNNKAAVEVLKKHLGSFMSMESLVAAMGFMPYSRFDVIWKKRIKDKLLQLDANADQIKADILREFAEIDIGED